MAQSNNSPRRNSATLPVLKYKVGTERASGSQPQNLTARQEQAARGASSREGWAVAGTLGGAKAPPHPGSNLGTGGRVVVQANYCIGRPATDVGSAGVAL